MKTLGIILIAVGVLMLVFTGINYTTQETIVDLGPIDVTAEKERTIGWPPIVGGVLLIGGVILFAVAGKEGG